MVTYLPMIYQNDCRHVQTEKYIYHALINIVLGTSLPEIFGSKNRHPKSIKSISNLTKKIYEIEFRR